MNRRWSVALVIVMLAALAPAAALAGPPPKPVDAITGITWTSLGNGTYAGECNSSVTVQYTVAKGSPRRYEIAWKQAAGYIGATGNKVERDGEVTATRSVNYMDVNPPLVDGAPAYVWVRLFDGKLNTLAGPVTTPTYQFTAGSCPASGTSLGTYPAP